MGEVLSEALGVRMVKEVTAGTAPATGWIVLQPDVGGISGWKRTIEFVERDIHSVNATMEKGDEVGRSASPSIVHDYNKDFRDLTSEAAFRCTAKHAGGGTVSAWRDVAIVAGVKAELDLDTPSTNCDTVIEATTAGAVGNDITITFVDGGSGAGVLSRIGTAFTFTFANGVTTVANFEAAVTALAGADDLIGVKTAGTGGNLLATTDDEFAATPLASGVDAYFATTAGGALAEDMLVFTQGYENDVNNGLHLVTTGSDATHLYVSTVLVAETPDAAALDIAGYQGTAGDLELDANGNLISSTKDLTTLGLAKGWRVKVGGTAAVTKFATALLDANGDVDDGLAYVKSDPTTNLIELERHSWTPGAADEGTGKTIQVLFTRFYRNYPIGHASYKKATLHGEKETPGAGSDGTTRFTYLEACAINNLSLSAPLKSKITATASMVAFGATDPVATASRVTGPSIAHEPIGTDLADTSNDLRLVRLADADGTLIARINSWTLTINNNAKVQYAQGDSEGFAHSFGKFNHSLSMEAFYEDAEVFAAATENRSLFWDAMVANEEGGFSLCLPHVALRNPEEVFAANEPVMLNMAIPAFRQASTGIAGSLSEFAYYPPRT